MVLLNSGLVDLGTAMPGFSLPDTVSGKIISNKDIDKEIAVIAFICNHCPYVVRIIKDFSALARKTSSTVSFIAISANDPDYRTEDSPENMLKFAKQHSFNFPYLFDETQEVARKFKAVCTPDIFVYKSGSCYQLVYHARFEDLEKAISELASVGQVNFEQLPSVGCSIKWKSKNLP